MPGVMAGLQQAWGFAWKALMAGEVIVAAAHAGLGHLIARPGTSVPTLLAALGVILVLGVAVDYLLFGQLDRRIRRRRGLLRRTLSSYSSSNGFVGFISSTGTGDEAARKRSPSPADPTTKP